MGAVEMATVAVETAEAAGAAAGAPRGVSTEAASTGVGGPVQVVGEGAETAEETAETWGRVAVELAVKREGVLEAARSAKGAD